MLTLPRWCWTSSATTRPQFNWGSRSGTKTSSSSRQVYCHCLLQDDNKQLAKTTTVFFFVSMKASLSARADYQCKIICTENINVLSRPHPLLLKVGWTQTMPSWSCCSLSTPANLPLRSRSRCRPSIFDPTPRIYCEAPHPKANSILSAKFWNPVAILGHTFLVVRSPCNFHIFRWSPPTSPTQKEIRSRLSDPQYLASWSQTCSRGNGYSHWDVLTLNFWAQPKCLFCSFKQRPNVFQLDVWC